MDYDRLIPAFQRIQRWGQSPNLPERFSIPLLEFRWSPDMNGAVSLVRNGKDISFQLSGTYYPETRTVSPEEVAARLPPGYLFLTEHLYDRAVDGMAWYVTQQGETEVLKALRSAYLVQLKHV